ncbi:contractile injection system tape measure protein [Sorangium sp. So ce131]|uniref:contractile injection system tape measure protein n=1 Tax=Sorangium sp. So ce131 TaxID=3133282 RepID=UPI003F6000BB
MNEQPAPHRIRRQRWRMRARSQAEALEARRRLRDGLHAELQPALARAFDALSPGGEVLHVARLELRVCVPSVAALSDVLPELLQREVHERLGALLQGEPEASRPPAAWRRAPVERSRLEWLAHYLETGVVPWLVEGLDRAASLALLRPPSVAEAAAALGAGVPGAGVDEAQAAAVRRLLQLVDEADWAALARAAAAALPAAHRDALGDAVAAFSGGAAPSGSAAPSGGAAPSGSGAAMTRAARLQLAAAALAAGRAAPGPTTARALATALAGAFGAGAGRPALELVALLPEGARGFFQRVLAEGSAWPAPERAAAPAVAPPAAAAPPAARPPARPRPVDAASGDARGPADAPLPADLPPAAPRAPAAEPFGRVAICAGLLLVHPFLARLFEGTGLRRPDEAALPVSALPRAAALLYFLATGEEEAHEFELGFLKVLLGAPPEAPLSVAAGLLTGRDRDEADGLLRAVLGHWRALKSTSVRGLRASFLERRGLLVEQAQGSQLRVEPAPFDVLLGQLPWGIGVVKLPWMKKPLYAEWPAC